MDDVEALESVILDVLDKFPQLDVEGATELIHALCALLQRLDK